MLEREVSGYAPKVEVVYNPEQSGPFAVNKKGAQWQLGVNRTYFESRGFLRDEISGAVYLEEERLTRQTSITTQASVDGLRKWQETGSQDPKASAFKAAFERLAALSSLEERDSEKARLARKYLERFASRSPGTDYTDQLFNAVLKNGLGDEVTQQQKVVETVFNNLQKQEKIEGRDISPLDALTSPNISSSARASWFDARFLPRLQFLERQDQAKEKPEETTQAQEQSEEQQETPPPTPSSAQDEYEQHRGREEKGEGGQPIFVIEPGFTGYWEEDSFDVIDESNGRLIKSATQRVKTAVSTAQGPIIEDSRRTINGYSGTNLFSLPLAPSFQLTQDGLNNLRAQGIEIYIDPEGHTFLHSSSNQPIKAEIVMSIHVNTGIRSKDNTTVEQNLPPEIDSQLVRIRSLPIDSLGKVQEWIDFMKGFFKYPADEQVESMYSSTDNSPSRISAMTQGKLLDCYLAREFFLAGIKRLNLQDVEWRGVNGHFIASQQKDGTTQIHSGTGHAWVKLRLDGQRSWTIIDPTPPGDPIHQGEGSMDEFGEFSDQTISDEDLQEMSDEAQDSTGNSEKKPSSSADQYLMQFARETGLSPEEAQQILNTLAGVDQMKDRQGRLITARLREQFERIIEEYTSIRHEPLGTVEMSRGRDLEEPVSAFIDFKAGNLDPTGFSKKRQVEEKEEFYSGWDLEVVGDGSGSMAESLGGKPKYLVQRDMSYLLHRELHRFSQDAQRRRLRLVTPLKIRSSQYLFRGNKIEEIKPLTDEFTSPQMALLWKKSAENIGGGTPAHLGLQAILDRITPEEVQLLKDKKLLKVVALISDGGYDDSGRVRNLVNRLQEMNVVVAEFPITDANSLESLPQDVAEKVIETARLLMPERIKRG